MFQSDCFDKITNPEKYLADLIGTNVRPDGRAVHQFRPVIINTNTITSADGSAVIRLGNTNVICGIKADLGPPKPDEPDVGFLILNVDLRSHCSSKLRPGPPSDDAQVTNNTVYEIIKSSELLDLKKLCIVPEKLVWCLYCNVSCISNDGSIVDASVAAILAAMKTLKLPKVEYDSETEVITVDDSQLNPIDINNMVITTSFALYDNATFLVDPNDFEEEMCGGSNNNLTISSNGVCLSGFQKWGGSFMSVENQEKATEVAQKRAVQMIEAIDKSLKSPNKTCMLAKC